MRCEDFPACGHELGCCPRVDEDGNQTEMVCICGASIPIHSRTSLCRHCLMGEMGDAEYEDDFQGEDLEDDFEDFGGEADYGSTYDDEYY